MKKLFTILGMLFALSANAQVNLTPSAPSICRGNSLTLTVSIIGNIPDTLVYTYYRNGFVIWVSNDPFYTETPPTGVQSYLVAVSDVFGTPRGNGTTTVVVNPIPDATTSNTGPYCVGGTIQLNAGGGTNYSWSGPNGFSSNEQNPSLPATMAAAGTYTVTVTAAGCSNTASTNVVVSTPPTVQTQVLPPTCFGGSNGIVTTTTVGGTPPYSYQWSNGGTGPTVIGVGAGAYTVTVTDANGCTATASAAVTQPAQLVAVISNQSNVSCFGNSNGSATVQVVGGTPPYSIRWSTGAFVPTITGLGPGIYTVTVTDANGCTATASATILMATSPLVANITTIPSCGNTASGAAQVAVSGGQQPYSYLWSNRAVDPAITNVTAGAYTVTVTDANGCEWQGGVQIPSSPAIVLNLRDTTICKDSTIFPLVNGGTGTLQFFWTTPMGQIFTTQSINPTTSGWYNLRVRDIFGCEGSDSMFISVISCIATSIYEETIKKELKIYPNPTLSGQELTLKLPLNIQEVDIRVMDLIGKTVFTGRTNEPIYHISTSGLAAGTYFVQVATVDGSVSIRKKIIVQ